MAGCRGPAFRLLPWLLLPLLFAQLALGSVRAPEVDNDLSHMRRVVENALRPRDSTGDDWHVVFLPPRALTCRLTATERF